MEDRSNRTQQRSAVSPLRWAIPAVILVVAVAWGAGALMVRRTISPEALIHRYEPTATVKAADALTSSVTPTETYSTWAASSDKGGGSLYVVTQPNPFRVAWWARLLGVPPTVTVGTYIDDSYTIKGVVLMSPVSLPGAPSDLASYLDAWRETTMYTIVTTTGGIKPAGGGALGEALTQSINGLAASIYTRDLGTAGLQRLVDQAHQITIGVRDTFPFFAAKAADGTTFNVNSMKGRKFLVAFTRPTCGSCYEETMKLLNTVRDQKYGIAMVVFVFGGDEFAPVQQFMREAPAGAIMISDGDASIAATIHQTLAPYVVLVDENMQVRYSGSANSPGPIDDLLARFAKGTL
ncbi:MAG TPA: redoxin family protein [Clostridia bacterium]|nr:redoxin family protein [Clostridia bacterium]